MSEPYQEAMNYLYSFVNFEHRRIDQYSPENISLERPLKLLELLGHPQEQYPSIHIAGTKGKGSVAAMCATSLRQAGLTVGLYTSPHLLSFRDRIRVLMTDDSNGRISRDEVVTLTEVIKEAAKSVMDLTWYELITAMAFTHFARSEVDVAVIEVGLGGRLDATNVITPLVSVITSLSLDHTYLLGDTLSEIASEKGGIIKNGVPVVSAPQSPDALKQLRKIARSREAPLLIIGQEWDYQRQQLAASNIGDPYKWQRQITIIKAPTRSGISTPQRFDLSLAGRHQQENAAIALATLNLIQEQFPQLTWDVVHAGLAQVSWPGRFQVLPAVSGGAPILLDCAHNVDSAEKVAQALEDDFKFHNLWLIVGMSVDKDIVNILEVLLRLSKRAIVTASSHPRAAEPQELLELARELGYTPTMEGTVKEAILSIWNQTTPDDLICVTGSIFIVSDLLNDWEALESDLMSMELNPVLPLIGDGEKR
jgi:dihydrofolate synthase/folylpolyglutamate synthase